MRPLDPCIRECVNTLFPPMFGTLLIVGTIYSILERILKFFVLFCFFNRIRPATHIMIG